MATAGTAARLIVTSKDSARDGAVRFHIAIFGLNLGLAGTLPVRPDSAVIDRVAAGTPIAAKTLAAIGYEMGKVRVAIPLPFKLSNEAPNGGYTAAPLRTAAPIVNRRKPTPTPMPTPSPTQQPTSGPQPTVDPISSASPVPTPS